MTDANPNSGGKELTDQEKLEHDAMGMQAAYESPQGVYSTEPPTHSELTPEQETSVLKAVAEALGDFKAFPASDNQIDEGNSPVDPDPNTTGEEE